MRKPRESRLRPAPEKAKPCVECGKVLDVDKLDRRLKYCSTECRRTRERRQERDRIRKIRATPCPQCRKTHHHWVRGVCQPCYLGHYRAGTLHLLKPPRVAAPPCSVELAEKQCCTCKLVKPIEQFCKQNRSADGHARRCKTCYSEARVGKTEHYRDFELRRKYGISSEQYDEMYYAQDGLCVICGQEELNGGLLAVDHCHATGLVRGLLCTNCNNGLGRFKDNPDHLVAAAAYLLTNVSLKQDSEVI